MQAITTIGAIILITMVGFVLHELAHFLTSIALGYDTVLRINSVSTLGSPTSVHMNLITAAGPALTILLGLGGFLWARSTGSLIGFHLLVTSAGQRTAAAIISAIANPNDEMRLSDALGLGLWTVFAVVLAVLWGMVLIAALRVRPGWLYALWAWIGLTIGISAVVLSEPHLPEFLYQVG